MLRGLYRFYLYTVFIIMLFIAAFGVQQLLQTLFERTPLSGAFNTAPDQTAVIQTTLLGAIFLITGLIVGGLHHWLIRRDIRSDPTAKNSVIRAIFLNLFEAIFLPVAVGVGAGSIAQIGAAFSIDVSGLLAYSISILLAVALLEWEQRHPVTDRGAALILQRVQLYLVQIILLFILAASWLNTVGQIEEKLYFGNSNGNNSGNIISLIISTLVILAFWLSYGFLSRKDTTSTIRRIFHFISFGFGLNFVLTGIYRSLEALLLLITRNRVDPHNFAGASAPENILATLLLGFLIVGVYTFWLNDTIRARLVDRMAILLTGQAIATFLLGLWFWFGCAQLIVSLLQTVIPSEVALVPQNWITAVATIITGAAYIPLGLRLRRTTARTDIIAPLRGFVFALFGLGILAGAIGGAVTLYSYSTAILHATFSNWQYTAHLGTSAFVVGAIITGIYLWTIMHEGYFGRKAAVAVAPAPVPVATSPATAAPELVPASPLEEVIPPAEETPLVVTPTESPIGEILDSLLAGKLTREESLARIEALNK